MTHSLYGFELKLLCEEDAGSGCFIVRCDRRHVALLRPYATLLSSSADGSIDPPVIPIHSIEGSSTFSPSGALYDYPELLVPPELPAPRLWSTEIG